MSKYPWHHFYKINLSWEEWPVGRYLVYRVYDRKSQGRVMRFLSLTDVTHSVMGAKAFLRLVREETLMDLVKSLAMKRAKQEGSE